MGAAGGRPAPRARRGSEEGLRRQCSAGLPPESLPHLLELLDARGLASLRRSFRLHDLGQEAYIAELQAAALELLLETKFPFTHAAYVLGLNGPYYSLDTIAEKHYGIPKTLPSLLCALFRAAVPGVAFTTLRMQKLAAAANFGGQHKTLAFSLSPLASAEEGSEGFDTPSAEGEAGSPSPETPTDAGGGATPLLVSPGPGLPGYVLCLTEGCLGGHGEVCDDLGSGNSWRYLTGPQIRSRWTSFPADAWLRWHWPRQGDLYIITATCEAPSTCNKLRRRERRQMAKIGFLLPEGAPEADEASDSDDREQCAAPEGPARPPEADTPTSPSRPNAARVAAARRLLALPEESVLTTQLVEDAFRRSARQVHPDRAASDSPIPASWLMSQLTWARRILREAAAHGVGEVGDQEAAAEVLMLAAPHPE